MWYEFTFNGNRVRRSTKQTNHREAQRIEAAHKTRLAKGEVGIVESAPAPTFVEFAERFLNWIHAEKADKPGTATFYADRVRQLLKYDPLKTCTLDEIDEEFVADYVQWRRRTTRSRAGKREKKGRKLTVHLVDTRKQVSVASVNRDLATLKRILNVAREWKVIVAVPRISLLPGETNHERILTHEEEDWYLTAASPLLRDFAVVALDTGMRPAEVLMVRFENVHFDPKGNARYGYIRIPEGKTKRSRRTLPMTARVQGLMERRYAEAGRPKWGWAFLSPDSDEQVSYDTIKCQHDRIMAKRPKADRWRLYDMRHTYLTRLGESGADTFTIQKLAGHSSIVTTQRYVHPTPERIEDAIGQLEAYNATKGGREKEESA